ncbi:unnamed protein product [Spirodela intermedia]|uniref:DUF3741 domain-containing protein n=1 Tax=Spirodela intermedia TaxID=51605 RepID=A0A7I8LEY7_SPIIN|nr:unnamed protein product [Spirodela intermedia]
MPPPPSPAPSSSLAMVAERRPLHRPGGCTGVLFQLFDWNHHRLASKKLFSRRLLPQARAAKRISKKFSANEKMPPAKLLLIADENRGSFPSSKKADAAGNIAANGDRGKRMCSPNLVARLMGLDSMPTADGHGRPRKAEDGASTSSEGGGGCCYFDGSDTSGSSRHCQDPGFEIAAGGGGRRPQKQRKTAIFDRLPETTAGVSSEATLLFNRNLLARPRKSHPKPPPSPIRSPRLAGRTSSALLMEAAARILEPRMQSRSRGRPSLTFPSPYQATPESAQCSASPLGSPTELVGASSVRPCRNCGNQVGAPEEITEVSETSVMDSAPSSTSSDFSQTSSAAPKPPALPKKEIVRRNSMERKKTHQLNEPQVRSKPRRVAAVSRSTTPRQSTARPIELPSARAKASPPPKPDVRQRTRGLDPSSSSESRENLRNLSRARTRSMGGGRTEIERSAACEKKPLARKRRSTGSNIQSEEGAPPKQRSIAAGGVHNPRGSSGRRKTMEARDGGGGERSSDEATTASGSVTEETSGGPVRNPDETVDALSALLEQKIRELSDLGRDESVAGILEELISALTFAQTETQRRDYGTPADLRTEGGSDYGSSNLPECRSYQGPNLCVIEDFQEVNAAESRV